MDTPFRFLTDENFNGDIVRGLKRVLPDLDIVRVQDVGLAGLDDPTILAWAADNNRTLLTHDRATMPDYAYERLATGETMPGVLLFDEHVPVGDVIQELRIVVDCSKPFEWNERVVRLPW